MNAIVIYTLVSLSISTGIETRIAEYINAADCSNASNLYNKWSKDEGNKTRKYCLKSNKIYPAIGNDGY